jgi:nitrogen-specific signal transduction histidine kinase
VQQLEQVFINVIVNALESLPDRSRSVKVSATGGSLPASRIIVQVEDQGKGIAEDVMAQIGEPFFTTKAKAVAPGWACRSRRRSSKSTAGACASSPTTILAPRSASTCRSARRSE